MVKILETVQKLRAQTKSYTDADGMHAKNMSAHSFGGGDIKQYVAHSFGGGGHNQTKDDPDAKRGFKTLNA